MANRLDPDQTAPMHMHSFTRIFASLVVKILKKGGRKN